MTARSEATKAATLPTSSSVATRPSMVRRSNSSRGGAPPSTPGGIVSGIPPVRRVTNRTPWRPSSEESWRRMASMASKPT